MRKLSGAKATLTLHMPSRSYAQWGKTYNFGAKISNILDYRFLPEVSKIIVIQLPTCIKYYLHLI